MAEPGVLVTRPAGQGQALAQSLQQMGCRPVCCPMLEIVPIARPDAAQRAMLSGLAEYSHIIFVSANAVAQGMGWIEEIWPQPPSGPNWYTIGSGSAAALALHGIESIRPEQDLSSEGLLAMPQLASVADQRILIVRGEGGRTLLRETLSARGALVHELAAYRRCPPQLATGELAALIGENDCRLILVSSGEGLHNMVSLLSDLELAAVRELGLVVPGPRVAKQADRLGFSRVSQAANATDDAMIDAVQQYLASGV
ncbi:MAG: uroporphyrinogen-III synthase [Halieaceae bacterium]